MISATTRLVEAMTRAVDTIPWLGPVVVLGVVVGIIGAEIELLETVFG